VGEEEVRGGARRGRDGETESCRERRRRRPLMGFAKGRNLEERLRLIAFAGSGGVR